ncbi:hypothetical protein U0070_022240, partial [Myodes glareolus]
MTNGASALREDKAFKAAWHWTV